MCPALHVPDCCFVFGQLSEVNWLRTYIYGHHLGPICTLLVRPNLFPSPLSSVFPPPSLLPPSSLPPPSLLPPSSLPPPSLLSPSSLPPPPLPPLSPFSPLSPPLPLPLQHQSSAEGQIMRSERKLRSFVLSRAFYAGSQRFGECGQ